MNTYYTNQKPLECREWQETERSLGVWISEPFMHHGRNEINVEICMERLCINTMTFGGAHSLFDMKRIAKKDTVFIIEQIDKIIKELKQHQERLEKSLNEIDSLEIHT